MKIENPKVTLADEARNGVEKDVRSAINISEGKLEPLEYVLCHRIPALFLKQGYDYLTRAKISRPYRKL